MKNRLILVPLLVLATSPVMASAETPTNPLSFDYTWTFSGNTYRLANYRGFDINLPFKTETKPQFVFSTGIQQGSERPVTGFGVVWDYRMSNAFSVRAGAHALLGKGYAPDYAFGISVSLTP